jgi:hypothetical protein
MGVICHESMAGFPRICIFLLDADGYAYGGHLPVGGIVLHSVTIMIVVIEKVDMIRKWDDSVTSLCLPHTVGRITYKTDDHKNN